MTNPVISTDSAERKPMGRLRWWLLGAGALALAALLVGPALLSPSAQAGSKIGVTTTADELNADGDCSLREAIQAANTDTAVDACTAGSGADVINLPAGIYTLTIVGTDEDANATGDLDILEDLIINGEGEATTIIDGNASARVIEVLGFSTVEITDVTVRNGSTEVFFGDGGGIRNAGGTVTLTDSTVSGNTATLGGGGISNIDPGTLTLTDSIVSGNTAGVVGGGIFNLGGTVTLTDSTVSGNTAGGGGGIQDLRGTVTLTNSTVSGNDGTDGFGGGISTSEGTLTLTASTVSGNTAGFDGGGISNGGGTVTLTDSTVSGNTAGVQGGGIRNGGTVTLTNSTVSGNTANVGGGGIATFGGTVTLKNTIVADNGDENCGGADPVTSLGNNLEDDDTCGLDPLATKADLINTDPLLGPLADNGGPTETHALLAGSPAIDAGHDGACPATDQRGVARPQGAACDIGAYEFELALPGDVDKDGDVDVFDALAILAAIAGFQVLEFPENGDVNGDGTTNVFDALETLGIVAGL